jgi:hypothetical protein
MLKSCLNILTSLRLTVVLLGLALILVFAGTLAEVHMGLYDAQAEIFRSFFVRWTPPGTHLRIPVFPGGWFIGLALLFNLLAADSRRADLPAGRPVFHRTIPGGKRHAPAGRRLGQLQRR